MVSILLVETPLIHTTDVLMWWFVGGESRTDKKFLLEDDTGLLSQTEGRGTTYVECHHQLSSSLPKKYLPKTYVASNDILYFEISCIRIAATLATGKHASPNFRFGVQVVLRGYE